MALKDKLRRLRGEFRQKQFAAMLGLPLPTYRKYELGKRIPNQLAMAELNQRITNLYGNPEFVAAQANRLDAKWGMTRIIK